MRKRMSRILAGTVFLLGVATGAQAAFTAVGPVSLKNGWPLWIQDSAAAGGLQLALCDDPADPRCGLLFPPEPGNRFSQQIGFGGGGSMLNAEAFYWVTNEGKATPKVGVSALRLILSAQVGFLPPIGQRPVGQGDQMGFSRLSVISRVLVDGNFTINYPFGIIHTVASNGGTLKDVTDTIGALANAGVPPAGGPWSGMLPTPMGPNFLKATVFAPFAAQIGDGGVADVLAGAAMTPPTTMTITGPVGAFGPGVATFTIPSFLVLGKVFNNNPAVPFANVAPIAVADTAATGAGKPVIINVTANDTDPDGLSPTGVNLGINPKAVGIVATPAQIPPLAGAGVGGGARAIPEAAAGNIPGTGTTLPQVVYCIDPDLAIPTAHGSVQRNPDGTMTYTPAAGVTGSDTFQYVVQDGGGLVSAPALVTVLIENLAVTAADFRPKLMKWLIKGTSTVTTIPVTPANPLGVNTITVHSGPTAAGPVVGSTTVKPDGTWVFEGKSSAMPSGDATITLVSTSGVTVPATALRIR